jgi:hypothetical protein
VDLRGYDEVPATSEHAVLSLLRALGGTARAARTSTAVTVPNSPAANR